MNFLKISGLVMGSVSVVGGTGAGIYYATNKNAKFVGKLVFFKKSGSDANTLYETKLLNNLEYNDEVRKFNSGKANEQKHSVVNKIVDISNELNVEETKIKLKEIFEIESNWSDIKSKINSKEVELKKLFGEEIYKKLEAIN